MTDADDFKLFLSEVDSVGEPQRGDLMHGHVIASDSYGLIIDLGMKRDGLAPNTDLERLPSDEEPIKVGDAVAVMVVDPVDANGNLVVSVSQARESDDWLKAQKYMAEDAIFEARPSSHNRGGLVVPFGRLRGFVPASHVTVLPRGLSDDERMDKLAELVGENMPFKVLEVDPQRHRLVLSERKAIRQWRQDQKERVIKTLREGEVRKGVVTSLREFGAFIDVGGADGLIHISELDWQHVDDPGDVLQIGQEVEVLVIRLDRDTSRIGLSLKRMQPNPWIAAAETVKPGMIMDGKVTRLAASGAYVAVAGSLEGLIRSDDHLDLPSQGMNIQVRVLSLNIERERMDLEIVSDTMPMKESA